MSDSDAEDVKKYWAGTTDALSLPLDTSPCTNMDGGTGMFGMNSFGGGLGLFQRFGLDPEVETAVLTVGLTLGTAWLLQAVWAKGEKRWNRSPARQASFGWRKSGTRKSVKSASRKSGRSSLMKRMSSSAYVD